ncbi:hypothetical protein ACFXKY_15740 [Streptomyces canus]
MHGFRKFMVGLTAGLVTWAATAVTPVISPWSSVLGLLVALVLWI